MKILKPKWYSGFDPTGWWMAEKFDGVRAEWDAGGPEFMSKADKHYWVPAQMTKELAGAVTPFYRRLSGEFWLGHKQFQKTVSIVRNQREDIFEWQDLKYMIFELPVETYLFEERQEILREYSFALPPWCKIIEWVQCRGEDHLSAFYNTVLANSGEGIVLSKPESEYHFGRSGNQVKLTPTYTDEAKVIGHTDGNGKHIGKVGALMVQKEDLVFKVGTGLSDAEREDPPPVGCFVTYSYKGLTNAGKPRHPAFIAVRDYE